MADVQAEMLTLSMFSHGHGALLWRLLDDLQRHASLRGVRVIVTLSSLEDFDSACWPGLDLLVLCNGQSRGFGANHNAAFLQTSGCRFGVLNPDPAPARRAACAGIWQVGPACGPRPCFGRVTLGVPFSA